MKIMSNYINMMIKCTYPKKKKEKISVVSERYISYTYLVFIGHITFSSTLK